MGAMQMVSLMLSGVAVALSAKTVAAYMEGTQFDEISAVLSFSSTGSLSSWVETNGSPGLSTEYPGEWVLPLNTPGYELRATQQTGTAMLGTFGSWVALSTTRTYYCGQSGGGARTATVLFEIRPTGGAVVASATITFTAEVNAGGGGGM